MTLLHYLKVLHYLQQTHCTVCRCDFNTLVTNVTWCQFRGIISVADAIESREVIKVPHMWITLPRVSPQLRPWKKWQRNARNYSHSKIRAVRNILCVDYCSKETLGDTDQGEIRQPEKRGKSWSCAMAYNLTTFNSQNSSSMYLYLSCNGQALGTWGRPLDDANTQHPLGFPCYLPKANSVGHHLNPFRLV